MLASHPVAACNPAFDDPKYLRRVAGVAMLSVLMVAVSSLVMFCLVALEVGLWSSGARVLRIAAVIIAIIHASYLVNTFSQAKRAVIDFWRCGNGKEPVSYTPERIMRVIEDDRAYERNRPDWFSFLFAVSSPFTPVAVFALCEVFAIQSETVWQKIADARAEAHHRPSKDRAHEMLRTSRQVVVARARIGVLAAA
jgi:hypothetical protein